METLTYKKHSYNLQEFANELPPNIKTAAITSMVSIRSKMRTDKVNAILNGKYVLEIEPFKSMIVFDAKKQELEQLTKQIKHTKCNSRNRRKLKRAEAKHKDELLSISSNINKNLYELLKLMSVDATLNCNKVKLNE